jgi:MFS family permease
VSSTSETGGPGPEAAAIDADLAAEAAARPGVRVQLRELSRPAWILFAGTFVNRAGTFILPFLALYMTNRGFSTQQAGTTIAVYGVGGLASQGLGGWLADRIGRRNSIAVSMFSSAAASLALWRADSLVGIIVIVFLLGVSAELYRPASTALLTDLVPVASRVTSFTVLRLAINLGWAFGLGLGGLMAEHSFGLLFVGDAITSAGFGLIALLFLPQGVRTRRHEEPPEGATRLILADRGFLLMMGAVFLVALVYMQTATTFSLQVRDAGHSSAVYGALLAMNGILIVFLELPITTRLQRGRGTRIIATGNLLVGLGFALAALSTGLGALVSVILLWTLGEMLAAPRSTTFVADRAPRHARGRYQAVAGGVYALAAIIGPALGTILYGLHPNALWLACGACGIVSALLASLAGRHPAVSPSPPG